MKKLYCLLFSATLVLISLAPVHAKVTTSQLESNVARKAKEQAKYYMFDRVKTMCEEWPGCEEWALARRKENPSFTIIDAEVEYFVENPKDASAWKASSIWHHNLYIETFEDLQTRSYIIAKDGNFDSNDLKEIKKFPGHPFTDMPSEHAKCVIETWEIGPVDLPKGNQLRKRWAGSMMDNSWLKIMMAIEQQRVIWDVKGNPLRWVRRLDWFPWFLTSVSFPKGGLIAQQNKLGGPFKYIDASKTNSILKAADRQPDFAHVIRH